MKDFDMEIRKREVNTAIKMNELGADPLNEKEQKLMNSYVRGEITYEELLEKAIHGKLD